MFQLKIKLFLKTLKIVLKIFFLDNSYNFEYFDNFNIEDTERYLKPFNIWLEKRGNTNFFNQKNL